MAATLDLHVIDNNKIMYCKTACIVISNDIILCCQMP